MATHSSILAWRIPWTGSLAAYSPWSHKELDTTEAQAHTLSPPEFGGTGQEACISQMLAKRQNTLREREPRFQGLSLQGLWKPSGLGLA